MLCCINILECVYVNVSEQDETFYMIWMIFDKLIEKWSSFKWTLVIGKQQSKIKQCTSKVLLDVDCSPKVMFSFINIPIVHCKHSQVEENTLVLICMCVWMCNLQKSENCFSLISEMFTYRPSREVSWVVLEQFSAALVVQAPAAKLLSWAMLAHDQDCTPMPYPNTQVLVLVYSVQEKQPQAEKIIKKNWKNERK